MKEYSLVGVDGNAFSIMGYVVNAMKKHTTSDLEIHNYKEKAMSGNYNNLLRVSQDAITKLNHPSLVPVSEVGRK